MPIPAAMAQDLGSLIDDLNPYTEAGPAPLPAPAAPAAPPTQ
jgi:hypothetical protein